ncbi:neural/ectodermal development factor IMP-L2-like [Tachypleus tridentatus]|uniref:neural/ectodermal development factor IMP-L2-like n=1 Tax=Tachypleus tridentatus TaxID=6853 RepID=UPI003FCF8B86
MSRGDDNRPLEDDKKYMVLDNGDLLIRNIRWEDVGIYTCTAQNDLGSDMTLTFLYPVKVLDNGDLLIRNIRWEDVGIYTCTAQNDLGSDMTLTFLYPVKP